MGVQNEDRIVNWASPFRTGKITGQGI